MKKYGFTLVEILAVIIMLGMIFLLAFPPILAAINKTKLKIDDSNLKILLTASDLFITDNIEKYPKINGNKYCITIEQLEKSGILPAKVYDINGKEISSMTKISIDVLDEKYIYNIDNECTLK